jgi:2-hydroxychromene-2-carboxylate isomerase
VLLKGLFKAAEAKGDDTVMGWFLVALDRAVRRVERERWVDQSRMVGSAEEAEELGIFGAPSFLADDELYWGDDRLEQAIARLKAP